MNYHRKFLVYSLFFFTFLIGWAQHLTPHYYQIPVEFVKETPKIKHLTTNDGFSRSAVLTMLQDQQGLMWFGTWDGLYQYDGYRLKEVCHSPVEGQGPSQVIVDIIEDDKLIYLGTSVGLAIWDAEKQKIIPFSSRNLQGKNTKGSILSLCMDHNKNIWISTSAKNIYLYNTKTRDFRDLSKDIKDRKYYVNYFYESPSGEMWATTQTGIYKIKGNSNNPDELKIATDARFDFLEGKNVMTIYEDSIGNIWTNAESRTYKITPVDSNNEYNVYSCEFPISLTRHAKTMEVIKFAEKGGDIYAATNNGLFKADFKLNKGLWMTADFDMNEGINDNNIKDLLIDREGGIWMATFYGGVNYLSPTVKNFSLHNKINKQISGHVASGIAEDKDHNIWISTEDGGVNFWNITTNEVVSFDGSQNSVFNPTTNNVQNIYAYGDYLFYGMFDRGFDVINVKKKVKKNLSRINSHPDRLPSSAYAFCAMNDSIVLVGTINGLYSYNINQNTTTHIKNTKGKINSIDIDQDGFIWAGSLIDGTYKINRKDFSLEHIAIKDANGNEVTQNILSVLAVGEYIYIGTQDQGLWRYDRMKNQFKAIAPNHFGEALIYKIIRYQHQLWVTTNRGMFLYNPKDHSIRKFTVNDGLRSNQFKINSGIKTFDDKIIVGSVNGINLFDPSKIVENETRPNVILTDFYLFNKPVDIHDPESPLKKSITFSDTIRLHQSHNNFTIKFCSNSFGNSHRNIFEYKLIPFEKEWQRTYDNNNMVTYTNLPAGKYTLFLRTSNEDGFWGDMKTLKIIIAPYWWATLPMKVLYLLIFIGFISFFIIRYRKKKKEEMRLFRLEKEQEVYHSKMEFFTFMVHEIRTPLTLILGPLSEIMKKKGSIEEVLPQLHVIERNGNRLLLLVNQLMDFRKVEEKAYDIAPKPANLKILVEQTATNFQCYCSKKPINIELSVPKEECWANIDREAVIKIITNILSNATKFTKDWIKVSIKRSEDALFWEIAIEDNGPGIAKENQDAIFDSFCQIRENLPEDYIGTGVGLFVVKRLLKIQGGSIRVDSEEGKGACFTASLPYIEHTPELQKENPTEHEEDLEHDRINESDEKKQLKRILVAEDNEDMRNYISSIFSDQYNVDSFENGKEALDHVRENEYDLVITDLMMPVMDGLTLCKTIKNEPGTCHIPVIILTAKDDEKSQQEGFDSEADMYVTKPFSTDILRSRVKSILNNREHLRQQFYSEPETTTEVLRPNNADKIFLNKLNEQIYLRIKETTISVDELASELAMGRTLFYQKVKGVTGLTPNDYIRTYRLKKAVELLKSGERRINEVYYQVGFSSSSYFAKRFTLQFGLSPSDFIKKLDSNENPLITK